jgi:hypothetical protein
LNLFRFPGKLDEPKAVIVRSWVRHLQLFNFDFWYCSLEAIDNLVDVTWHDYNSQFYTTAGALIETQKPCPVCDENQAFSIIVSSKHLTATIITIIRVHWCEFVVAPFVPSFLCC